MATGGGRAEFPGGWPEVAARPPLKRVCRCYSGGPRSGKTPATGAAVRGTFHLQSHPISPCAARRQSKAPLPEAVSSGRPHTKLRASGSKPCKGVGGKLKADSTLLIPWNYRMDAPQLYTLDVRPMVRITISALYAVIAFEMAARAWAITLNQFKP